MDTKKSWQSKTVWLNAVTLAVAVAGFLTTNDLIKQHPVAVATLVVLQSVGNLILRFATTKGLTLK